MSIISFLRQMLRRAMSRSGKVDAPDLHEGLCVAPGIVVVDDFLPDVLFAKALKEFREQPTLDITHTRNERAFPLKLPMSIQTALDDFLVTGHQRHQSQDGGDEPASGDTEIVGHSFCGKHPDHTDVTCTGSKVSGNICLLYLQGPGTLVFTDQEASGRAQHRVEIQPNRAVRWPNSRYSHSVEVQDGDGPRAMLGPYTLGSSGQLTRTMSPKGMIDGFGAVAGIMMFIAAFVGFGVLVCGGLIQMQMRKLGMGILWRVLASSLLILLASQLKSKPLGWFVASLAIGTLCSGAIIDVVYGFDVWQPK